MERVVKKYEQRYRRAMVDMRTWESLQSRLLKLVANASAILERLPVLSDKKNYGILGEVMSMTRALPAVQVESLEKNFRSIQDTLVEMDRVCRSLEKLWRDGCQLLKAEKVLPSDEQAQKKVGARPSLKDCLDGLHALYIMHRDELSLKVAIVSALSYDSRTEDVAALQTVLADQPNIPSNEVGRIFEHICAGDVW